MRIVCNNTLNAALQNCTNVVRLRHTTSVKERLSQAHKVMGLCDRFYGALETTFNHWAKVRITDPQVRQLIQLAVAPNREVFDRLQTGDESKLSTHFQNAVSRAYAYAMGSASQQTETARGTLFGAYNAVTGYYQNVRAFKTAETKLDSLLFGGTAQNRTQRAFDFCEEFSKRGEAALYLN